MVLLIVFNLNLNSGILDMSSDSLASAFAPFNKLNNTYGRNWPSGYDFEFYLWYKSIINQN